MPAGTQGAMASAQPISQPSHRGAPVSSNAQQQAVSPPSKEQLKSWWTKFGRKKDKPEEQVLPNRGIFGIPLAESILYANVAISLTNEQGESFIYGYVPIVVAKCGVFLKEKATDVEGIFRLSGSAKRIKDLQAIFNSPERYGKGLDWTGYTVHDAANILRRYLNQLPEPIVPLDFYEKFRDPLRAYQAKVGNDSQARAMEHEEHKNAVVSFQRLITQLPALNRQLLLYILDLLAVFASKSDLNRMTAQNLAAIFQPGIISHPSHDMAPNEYRLSQDVLIFLIENQDHFLVGMAGTAMDEKTKDEVKSGPPSVATPKATTIGRSASTASAGADSLRRTAGVRRNASLSSRNSRDRSSPNVSSPATPASPSGLGSATGSGGGGLGRSNTVPSNRSPAMSAGHRFQRVTDSNQPGTPTINPPEPIPGSPPDDRPQPSNVPAPSTVPNNEVSIPLMQKTRGQQVAVTDSNQVAQSSASMTATQELRAAQDTISTTPINGRQTRERKISNLLAISPIFGPSDQHRDPNQRQPRKLQKRRIPGAANESAQSSQASLNPDDGNAFHTPLMTPSGLPQQNHVEGIYHAQPHRATTPTSEYPPEASTTSPRSQRMYDANRGLAPAQSPTPSLRSRGSATDPSDLDALEDPVVREEKRRHRWRPSKQDSGPLAPPPPIGQNAGAGRSNSSLGSNRPRKSFTGESHLTQSSNMESTGHPSAMNVSSRESSELLNQQNQQNMEGEKTKGFFGRMKAKIQRSGEDKRDERDRAKSPPRLQPDQTNSRSSLSAFAHEHFSPRGRSFDKSRDETLPVPYEQRGHERTGSKTPVPPQQGQATGVPASGPATARPLSTQMYAPAPAQAAADSVSHASEPSAAMPTSAAAVPVPVFAPATAPESLAAANSNEVPIAGAGLAPNQNEKRPDIEKESSDTTIKPEPMPTADQGRPAQDSVQKLTKGEEMTYAQRPL